MRRSPRLKRAGVYLRVSTQKQADKYSSEAQRAALLPYCEAQGYDVQVFEDEAISGFRSKRPGLDALVAAIKKRQIDILIIYHISRLGRSLKHLLEILELCDSKRVELVSYSDGFDTSTPMGRVMFQVAGAFAEYERELIRERTIAGLEAARRRGAKIGRPYAGTSDLEKVAHLYWRGGGTIQGLLQALTEEGIELSRSSARRRVKAAEEAGYLAAAKADWEAKVARGAQGG